MEYDFDHYETEIKKLADQAIVFHRAEDTIGRANPFFEWNGTPRIVNGEPFANKAMGTAYVSTLATDNDAVKKLLMWSYPINGLFKSLLEENSAIAQVYFNSPLQANLLYPPYAAEDLVEPDLDLNKFNFYYEATFEKNPSKERVWIPSIYLDPVGKGWMVSLLYPVYDGDEFLFVLGFDITLKEIIENYVNQYSKQLIIIDSKGTLVAGKSRAIEALSLPPLKDHVYSHTITSDSFRPDEFNLFKSKNQLVRNLASEVLLGNKVDFYLKNDFYKFSGVIKKIERMNWYLIDLEWQ